MPLIKRLVKGSPLTFAEGDANLDYLENLITGSLTISSFNSWTGSNSSQFSGTASFAKTASYALNAGAGAGFPYSGSAVITGSLLVSGSGITVTGSLKASNITGSLFGTASWAYSASNAINSLTASYVNPLNQNVIITGSLNVTQAITGSSFDFGTNRFIFNNGLLRYNTGENPDDIVVYNDAKVNHHLIVDGDNDYVILQRESGNVGIGISAPTAKLNVSGTVLITGSLTVSGSSTFRNIGPAIFSGSVSSNGGFTGSFSGNGSNLTNLSSQVGGNTGEIQFNVGGAFNGVSTLTYDGSSQVTATNIKATGIFAEYVTTTTIGNTSPFDPDRNTNLTITQSGTYIVTIFSTVDPGEIYFPDPTTRTGEKIRIQNRDSSNAANIGVGDYGRPQDINGDQIASISTLVTKLFISNGTNWLEI